MGLLIDGKWEDQWYDTKSSGGRFVRKDSAFRNWITADGSAGPTGGAGFKAEAGALSPLCFLRLSMGTPNPHFSGLSKGLRK